MSNKTNRTVMLWVAFILFVLFVGLKTEMSANLKSILIVAAFIVNLGLFFGARQ